MNGRQTQRGQILSLLAEADGDWVPLPAILDLRIGLYNTRILELRRGGYVIENKVERDESGAVRSWYRLVDAPEPEPIEPEKKESSDYMKREREEEDRAMPLFAGVKK